MQLRAEPDWATAAQLLIDGCAHLPDGPARVGLLERLSDTLGPALYPALLGVLSLIGDRGSPQAKSAVAATLVEALRSGRLPSGRRAAWGAQDPATSLGGSRTLGPVEYLCAAYSEPGAEPPMEASGFQQALRALLGLFSLSDIARTLYCERLRMLADDPLDDGALSRGTRDRLRQLAVAWQVSGNDLHASVAAYLHADAATSLQGLRGLPGARSLR